MNRAAARIVAVPINAFGRWQVPDGVKVFLVVSSVVSLATYSVLKGRDRVNGNAAAAASRTSSLVHYSRRH